MSVQDSFIGIQGSSKSIVKLINDYQGLIKEHQTLVNAASSLHCHKAQLKPHVSSKVADALNVLADASQVKKHTKHSSTA